MKSLGDYRGKTLSWTQPKAIQRSFELRSDSDLYATLTWEKTFGSLATGKCAEEEVSLKRGGFLRPYISVRRKTSQNDIALLHMGFSGNGELELADGRKYSLRKLSFWKSQWGMTDWNGMLLFKISERRGFLRHTGDIRFESPLGRPSPSLTMLLIIAWYSIVLIGEEQAGAAGAVSAASVGS